MKHTSWKAQKRRIKQYRPANMGLAPWVYELGPVPTGRWPRHRLAQALQNLLTHVWDGRKKANTKRDYHLMVAEECANRLLRKFEEAKTSNALQPIDGLPDPIQKMRANDVWSEDPRFTRKEWASEVGDNNTNLGYWEWVASQYTQHPLLLEPGDEAYWNDPDNGRCSRNLKILAIEYKPDGMVHITEPDGGEIEVLESELQTPRRRSM